MKNKKKILIGIILLLLLVGVIIGVYFFTVKKGDKQTKSIKEYGIANSYITRKKVNNASKHNYTTNNDGKTTVYDLNGKELLSYDSQSYLVELDEKYILVSNSNSEKIIYDINGNLLHDEKNIIEIYSNNNKYFIINNKLYNYDLKEIYSFNNNFSIKDYIGINDYLLYTYNSKNNFCVDLSNGYTIIEGYDDVISSKYITLFHKDGKYLMYDKNKKIGTYDEIEYMDFYYDSMAFNDHSLLLKLIDGEKVQYLIDGKVVNKPELKINDITVDLGTCTSGGKIKKDNKVVIDTCLLDIYSNKDVIVALDSTTFKSKFYVNNQDKSKKNSLYSLVGDYVVETVFEKDAGTVLYNNKGKKVGDFNLINYNGIYVKDGNGQYFLDDELKEISTRYYGINCNEINKYCSVSNDDGLYSLFYKNNKLTEFIYGDVIVNDDTIILNDGIFNQILILDINSDNKDVPKMNDSEINNIDIKKIKEDNNLDFDIPQKYEELFKKYAYVVENNSAITKYKTYVYDLFQIIMKDNIYPYLNEPFFFDKLGKLSIIVKEEIASAGVGGYYFDGSTSVELNKEYSSSTYHELVHFLDFTINKDNNSSAWICNNKLLDTREYYDLSANDRNKCNSVFVPFYTSNVITEAGAELYSAKYFKKGVISYFDITAYVTGLEYLIGSEKMDELFFAKNSSFNFMKLFIDNGFTLEEYGKINDELSKCTYPERYTNNKITGKAIDSLIDLYKIYKKDKNWQEDEGFKYIIKTFLGIYTDDKYKNSKYRDELEKITYKSFESYKKYENEMLKGFQDEIAFTVSPPPPYIIDNILYLGTKIDEAGKTFGYIRYDFDNNKIIEYKYPIYIK